MKPEDEIVVTITLGELAKIYAIHGGSTGRIQGSTLWDKAKNKLDPYQEKYDNFDFDNVDNILYYHEYQAEWESLLFEDETTRKIKELEATIALAQQQIQELKESE